jgi:RNA polymerase sigma factor (sigma-70 family)
MGGREWRMRFVNHSDGELLEAYVRDRVEGAFAELFARHGEMVRSVCSRVSASEQDADEGVQIVFATLARRAASLVNRPNVAGWLHRVALHTSLRARRDAALRRVHERAAGMLYARTVAAFGGLVGEREDLSIEVHRAINDVPDPFRVVLVLHYMEGRSIRDVADLLGCPVGTAASRLSRGRQLLKKCLGRRDVKLTAVALTALLVADLVEPATTAKARCDSGGREAIRSRRSLGLGWVGSSLTTRWAAALILLCCGTSAAGLAIAGALEHHGGRPGALSGKPRTDVGASNAPPPASPDSHGPAPVGIRARNAEPDEPDVVITPEPATFLAVGMGAAGMLLLRMPRRARRITVA